MKTFLVVSDIHVPTHQRDIPLVFYDIAKEVDGIIAVGDFIDLDTVLTLQSIAKTFHGVHGNVDRFDVKEYLPEMKTILVEGLTIGLIHGWGPPWDLRERIYRRFLDVPDLDVIIYGHTHEPFDGVEHGIRFLNPGTATPGGTYAILTVRGKEISFEIQRL